MRRVIIAISLAAAAGCTNKADNSGSAEPPAAKTDIIVQAPAKARLSKQNLKDFLLSERSLHEITSPHSPNGDCWSFWTNGTFSAAALTGRESWGIMGTWSEQPDGSILLEGVETNAFEPNRVYPPYKKIYNGMSLIDQVTGEKTAVQFRKNGE